MLLVADLMGQKFIIPVMDLLLLLMAVKSYVTQLLIASTFPTAKNGTTVNCAPNAISLTEETQGTTHLGRRSEKVCSFHHVCYRIGILTIKSVEMCRCNFGS